MAEIFLKYFSMMGHDRLTKLALVSFPQTSSFNASVYFGPNLDQNHATLCSRQLCLMIHSLKILKYSMMGCNSWTRIILVYLQKKSLSRRGQSGPNLGQNYAALCLMIHSLRIFLTVYGIMRHNIDRQK